MTKTLSQKKYNRLKNSPCKKKSPDVCRSLKDCKYVSSKKRNYCRKSKNKSLKFNNNNKNNKINLCGEDNYKLIKECKNIKRISLTEYIKLKSIEVQYIIKDDSKLYDEYNTQKFKNYVKKHLKKYVSYIGKNSNNYYDYSPGEIAKMIYEDFPSKPGNYLY